MTDAFDLMRQAKWEQEGTNRAVRLYREAVAEAVAAGRQASLPTGKLLLREIMPKLVQEIQRKQTEVEESITKAGNQPRWWFPISLLSAEVLGAITLTVALRCLGRNPDEPPTVTASYKAIAQAARDQLEYEGWVREQAAANRSAAIQGDTQHRDILGIFRRRYPKADRRTWTKWRRNVLKLTTQPWDEATKFALGGCLVSCLITAAPERFRILDRFIQGKTMRTLEPSQSTIELMRDIDTRQEVGRPLLMPMIIPPTPWAYREL